MGTGLSILDTYIPKVCKGDYITVTLTSSILLFYFDIMLTLFLHSAFSLPIQTGQAAVRVADWNCQ